MHVNWKSIIFAVKLRTYTTIAVNWYEIAILSLAYAPALYYLRGFNAYQNYEEDGGDVGGGGVIRYD